MSRPQRVALLGVVVLAAGVLYVATRTRQPPAVPADEDHASYAGPGACLVCHGPDGGLPRGPNHPLGEECLRCHGVRR